MFKKIFKKNEEINFLKKKVEALLELNENEREKNKELRILLIENNISIPKFQCGEVTCDEFAAVCNKAFKKSIEENNDKVMTKDEIVKMISDVTCKCPEAVMNSVDSMEEQYNKINLYHEFYEKYLKSTKSFGEAIDKIAADWKNYTDAERQMIVRFFTENNMYHADNISALFYEGLN